MAFLFRRKTPSLQTQIMVRPLLQEEYRTSPENHEISPYRIMETDENDDPADHIALLSMILGLLSFVPQAFYCGVLAVVFARKYKREGSGKNSGKTLAGVICGITGFLIGTLIYLFLLLNWDTVLKYLPG